MFSVGQKVRRRDVRMPRILRKGSLRAQSRSYCLCHKKPCHCLAGTFVVKEIVKDSRMRGTGWRISVAGRVKVSGCDAGFFELIPGT